MSEATPIFNEDVKVNFRACGSPTKLPDVCSADVPYEAVIESWATSYAGLANHSLSPAPLKELGIVQYDRARTLSQRSAQVRVSEDTTKIA